MNIIQYLITQKHTTHKRGHIDYQLDYEIVLWISIMTYFFLKKKRMIKNGEKNKMKRSMQSIRIKYKHTKLQYKKHIRVRGLQGKVSTMW